MNKSVKEAVEYAQSIGEQLEAMGNIEVVICPHFLALPVLNGLFQDSKVNMGAQDVAAWKNGAKTGEVSAEMLAPYCQYVIVGHSERRKYCNESLEMINSKVKRAVQAGIKPVVCISNEEELEALTELSVDNDKWVIAYEPLEAIGSGEPSDPADVELMVKKIKKKLGKVQVIYGGSVSADNIKKYLKVADGALPGGASLVAQDFLSLCGVANG